MKLSIVIPAHNEEDSLQESIPALSLTLQGAGVPHEIVVVDDHSTDATEAVLNRLQATIAELRVVSNSGPGGFGHAIRFGLQHYSGDCVAIMMADLSDSPEDLLLFYHCMVREKVDCVFGNRWVKGGKVIDYPIHKKWINRLANLIIRITMHISYSDTTNAFKLYRREVIDGVQPLLSPHFNLTVEIPLKAIIRGYSYRVLPNSWTNRKYGVSKLKIKEMGSRYFFILVYCFVEKYFSRGDYKRLPVSSSINGDPALSTDARQSGLEHLS